MSEAASAPPAEPAPAPPPPAAPPRRPGALSAALAWLARRRWKALAVVLLLGLIGAGGFLIERHLRARHHLRAARAAADRYHNAEAAEHHKAYMKVWPRRQRPLSLRRPASRRSAPGGIMGNGLKPCRGEVFP